MRQLHRTTTLIAIAGIAGLTTLLSGCTSTSALPKSSPNMISSDEGAASTQAAPKPQTLSAERQGRWSHYQVVDNVLTVSIPVGNANCTHRFVVKETDTIVSIDLRQGPLPEASGVCELDPVTRISVPVELAQPFDDRALYEPASETYYLPSGTVAHFMDAKEGQQSVDRMVREHRTNPDS